MVPGAAEGKVAAMDVASPTERFAVDAAALSFVGALLVALAILRNYDRLSAQLRERRLWHRSWLWYRRADGAQ